MRGNPCREAWTDPADPLQFVQGAKGTRRVSRGDDSGGQRGADAGEPVQFGGRGAVGVDHQRRLARGILDGPRPQMGGRRVAGGPVPQRGPRPNASLASEFAGSLPRSDTLR